MGKLQTIEEEFHRDLQCDNLQSQSLMKSNIPANIQHYSEEDLMLSIARIAAESGEASEVDSKLQTYPGMPEKTIAHNTHPVDRVLLEAYRNFSEPIEDADQKGILEKTILNRRYIAFLADFCINTQFHIAQIEKGLNANNQFNQYPEFVNRSKDRVFVNEMRIRAINHLLLIALTNPFAKEALITFIQKLSEPHQAITLATNEYLTILRNLQNSIRLHREAIWSKPKSPFLSFEIGNVTDNLDLIESKLNKIFNEI